MRQPIKTSDKSRKTLKTHIEKTIETLKNIKQFQKTMFYMESANEDATSP